jgi:hypothetical protein
MIKELGFDTWEGQVFFSIICNIQSAFRIHTATYTMVTREGGGAASVRVQWQEHEADNSLSSSDEVKNGGTILQSPIHLHGMVLN